jgi:hypothetical protein
MGCLEQLQMAESVRFAERSANDGNWDTVKECLSVVDDLLRQGKRKTKLNNAASISPPEDLPRQGEVHDRLLEMMFPERRQGRDGAISYLEKLLGKRSS